MRKRKRPAFKASLNGPVKVIYSVAGESAYADPGGSAGVMTSSLRNSAPKCERRLLTQLKAFEKDGFFFAHQVYIDPYVVDFCDVGRKLIIEIVDELRIEAPRHKARARYRYLVSKGYRVLCYRSGMVYANMELLMTLIRSDLRIDHPNI